jgi:hypothetical protein
MKLLKSFFLCLLLSVPQLVFAQTGKIMNPFDTLKYDKVIAYDYDGMSGREIVKDGELIKPDKYRGRIFGQKELNREQTQRLHRILRDTASFGNRTAACFDPHLGIVYYYKGKITGYISICIDCNFLRASMPIPASTMKRIYYGPEAENYLIAYGFSRPARKKLNDFCKELKFTTCKEQLQSPMFDLDEK